MKPREEMSALLGRHDFRFQKKYGQNFLIDEGVLSTIVEAADLTKEDYVLEIGPGSGAMTKHLCEAAGHVTAVEIDQHLIPVLYDSLADHENLRIVCGDIMKMDVAKLLEEGSSWKVVANLPYYITTPILMSLLEGHYSIDSVTVMVQKEVADRMMCGPGSKDYGALSLAVEYYSEISRVCVVPPHCFMPAPKVESTVVHLQLHKEPPVKVSDEKLLFKLIRASFNQRRKTLVNGLYNSGFFSFSKEELQQAIEAEGFQASVRGEALSLQDFANLANRLCGEA